MLRVSYFFQQSLNKTGGWSENFWNVASTISDSTLTLCNNLLSALSNLKGNPVFCPYYRIGILGKFRQALTVYTQQTPGDPTATPADYPTTKLQVALYNGQQFTTQWLGGLYDSVINTGGFYRPTATFTRYFESLKTILTTGTNGWQIYGLQRAIPPALILTLNTTTGVITTGPITIADSALVRIKNVQTPKRANGVWRVQKTSDTQYTLYGWTAGTEVFKGLNAMIQIQGYASQNITDCKAIQSTSHKVGKPGHLLGGRRKKKAT